MVRLIVGNDCERISNTEVIRSSSSVNRTIKSSISNESMTNQAVRMKCTNNVIIINISVETDAV